MSGHTLRSRLAPIVEAHIALKRALGRRFDTEERVLRDLDAFLGPGDLNGDSFAAWCRTGLHRSTGVQRRHMRIARNLCLYRQRSEPDCFVPDRAMFPRPHQTRRPHIFREDEIRRLFEALPRLARRGSPLRREHAHLALTLFCAAGLRLGEVSRLLVGDFNPMDQTLLIRESKFYKSRLLPLCRDASAAITAHADLLPARGWGTGSEATLFPSPRRSGALDKASIQRAMRDLFRLADIRGSHVHDLRHTFAVRALTRWYHAGENVQAKLPALAAWMGHASVASTAYYLHFVEPLAGLASARFADCCASLIVTAPVPEGDRT